MAMQASMPPMKRAFAAMQADSNRCVCCSSISIMLSRSPPQRTDGSPRGSGNSGKVPLLISAKSIHARTSGESTVNAEVYSCCLTQKST
ncbi:Uncharacterised protein [Mycobacterium tuberculosis]|uniref:Uncharacterized protein n=1 Tax=Mycobacterium tuberculosis TaxID=1773 RepID=A0A0T9EJC2_MYCTX|nr:Uncharacterised protein [Mycobacterium tuberculosis]CKT18396.1 Uncharacterised protein [Mycobacterium tuberculosis]CNT98207.1 Uncharacterised protein [Mycobacterium tuberculosis]CNW04365.1 Uncharacterised protein [Mycobacterium tuberculosis]COW99465.1 Uncharacterised protein [Mycobacterium tuberculosis]